MSILEPGMPCSYCGVNAWTVCKHRQAEAPRDEFIPPPDARRVTSGGGSYRIKRK